MKTLLITKKSEHCKQAQEFIKKNFSDLTIIEGEFGDSFPKVEWKGDYIISFLSPWVLHRELLDNSQVAINFHPALPKYPGIGCYNFAIYNGDSEYGVTCHYMDEKVDNGDIIKVVRFPISQNETVSTLKEKSMKYLLDLFHEIIGLIVSGKTLPASKEKWSREPYTRKDLIKLGEITNEMSYDEIKKRIRATYFPNAKDLPYINIHEHKFILKK